MSGLRATLLAGIPADNSALFHRVRFGCGDPAAWLRIDGPSGSRTEFIVRDIERERAARRVPVDRVSCPADYPPAEGLSGDRATATAQAVAECLRGQGVTEVITDRSLPYIFAWHIQQAGLELTYDPELGVLDRRVKDEQELQWLAEAQQVTEQAMRLACQTVARASADAEGVLHWEAAELTSQRLQRMIAQFLLDRDYLCPHGTIAASLPHSADCHARGEGPLRTGQAVIIDIFPQSAKTRYHGDCTRTVVHGQPTPEMVRMHAAVVAAKQAACQAAVAGAAADAVHAATTHCLQQHGFRFARGQMADEPVMPHGTGHGIGLEVHEPILLDEGGGNLLAGEVLTIEPGLYSRLYGGVRVEDMLVIAASGPPRNLNQLPEGLDWR